VSRGIQEGKMEAKTILQWNTIKKIAQLFIILASALILAAATNLLFQGSQMLSNPVNTMAWVETNFKKFEVGTVFIFFIYMFIISTVGNFYTGTIIGITLFLGVAFANLNKMKILKEPLYPVDFYQIRYLKDLFSMIGVNISPLMILLVIIAIAALVMLIRKLPKLSMSPVPRLLIGLFSVYMIYSYLNYEDTFIKKYFRKAGMGVILWDQKGNYNSNGFVFGVLSNLQNEVMDKPQGYSEKAVKHIAEKYKKQAEKINSTRNNKKEIKPNIIYFMDEAFWDPTELKNVSFSEDPMKNIRKLMAEHSSGRVLSPEFGGNTANVELEALTGFSMYNVLPGTIPYQQSMDSKKLIPSIVSLLENEGYESLAIHAFGGSFYKRDRVYKTLGIDNFIDESEMKYKAALNKGPGAYINDDSVVKEVIDALKQSEKPTFMHIVTMQNHFPFTAGKFGTESVKVQGLSWDNKEQLEAYAEGVKQSDKAFKNFIDFLSQYEEPTVVVFFGDHVPKLEEEVFEEAGYKNSDALKNERMFSETPLVVYSNFHIDKSQLNSISPAFLGPTVFEMLNKPITPYYAMLEKVKKTVPGLKKQVIIDSKGKLKKELSKEEKTLIAEYNMIQYDLMMGQQYSLPVMFDKKP
jgi:phosphoglycerol transferase MdoB-like AlkP superfamily enzyme